MDSEFFMGEGHGLWTPSLKTKTNSIMFERMKNRLQANSRKIVQNGELHGRYTGPGPLLRHHVWGIPFLKLVEPPRAPSTNTALLMTSCQSPHLQSIKH